MYLARSTSGYRTCLLLHGSLPLFLTLFSLSHHAPLPFCLHLFMAARARRGGAVSLDMSAWHHKFLSRPYHLGLSIFIETSFDFSRVKQSYVLFPLWPGPSGPGQSDLLSRCSDQFQPQGVVKRWSRGPETSTHRGPLWIQTMLYMEPQKSPYPCCTQEGRH